MNLLTFYNFIILGHLLGIVIGFGSAIVADSIFMATVRTGKWEAVHISILELVSRMVWFGMAVILISGLLLFSQAPQAYLDNSQFLAKMTVVVVIFLNGVVFHFSHLALLKKLKNKPISAIAKYPKRRIAMLVSGAISVASWSTALFLGSTQYLGWPYLQIISAYMLVILTGIVVAVGLRERLIPSK